MSNQSNYEGPILGLVLLGVTVVAGVVLVQDLFQSVNLNWHVGWSMLWSLFLGWGAVYAVGKHTGLLLKGTWPFGLGWTWCALMPAFQVWLPENWYAVISPWWSQFGAFMVIVVLSYRLHRCF